MRSAIMDIGFNAIRAVVYENDKIESPEIFDSKFKNDILSLLENDDLEIKHQTYLTIQYFLHIFAKLKVTNIKCVATAVLREHPKAQKFVNFIKQKYQIKIDIISGEEEAQLTALGLMLGINNSNGIAADLGGGSLELVEISEFKIGRLKSLDLGTRTISDKNLEDQKLITNIIHQEYGEFRYDNLYLIGGGLRFIGRLYIEFMNYPIKNLHNLKIASEDFLYYLNKTENAFADQENKINRKKISTNSILVARSMIENFKPKHIILSTYGLKEGVRLRYICKQQPSLDTVLEKVKYTCNYNVKFTDFESYINIITTLTGQDPEISRIIKLSIMLLTLKYRFDNTFNPDALSSFILSSEIPFTHKERIKIVLILVYSTIFKPNAELTRISKKIISKKEHNICQIIGHFLYIAEEIDGSKFTKPSFSINIQDYFLEIVSEGILPRSIFEKICTRLKSIAYCRKMNSQ